MTDAPKPTGTTPGAYTRRIELTIDGEATEWAPVSELEEVRAELASLRGGFALQIGASSLVVELTKTLDQCAGEVARLLRWQQDAAEALREFQVECDCLPEEPCATCREAERLRAEVKP